MTVEQLRELLKQGDNDARELVNDLVSELPNQTTVWIDQEETRAYIADYLTQDQFDEFWDWMRKKWELIDVDAEIRSALEQWTTDQEDLLD